MERSIGCRMAELELMKGYNHTKTAISQERILKFGIQKPLKPLLKYVKTW